MTDSAHVWAGLTSPARIQAFLDTTVYAAEYDNRCPAQVIADNRAHCLDGAIFGAAALRRLGYPPLVIDLFPDPGMDDDHVLALYRQRGRWGAVAKSNFAGLRFREPVYRTLTELVMSYFENFFNVNGARTLRTRTRPLNLARFDRLDWENTRAGADAIEQALLKLPRIPLITPEMAAALTPVDELSYRAGTVATDPHGLYQPKA